MASEEYLINNIIFQKDLSFNVGYWINNAKKSKHRDCTQKTNKENLTTQEEFEYQCVSVGIKRKLDNNSNEGEGCKTNWACQNLGPRREGI